jgi:hypothetical protein
MSDGAKTGTPRELCLYCQHPVANQKEWDEIPGGEGDHLCWGECNERNDVDELLRKSRSSLTEAIKVAGDTLVALEKAELWIRENGHRGVAAPFRTVITGNRAALERIKSNTP